MLTRRMVAAVASSWRALSVAGVDSATAAAAAVEGKGDEVGGHDARGWKVFRATEWWPAAA